MYALQIDGATLGLIVTQIVGMILTLAGFFYQYLRETRQRAWDLQDRNEARLAINKKIDDNTNISKNAFHEANDAKRLISQIEEVRNKIQEKTIEVVDDMKDRTAAVQGFA